MSEQTTKDHSLDTAIPSCSPSPNHNAANHSLAQLIKDYITQTRKVLNSRTREINKAIKLDLSNHDVPGEPHSHFHPHRTEFNRISLINHLEREIITRLGDSVPPTEEEEADSPLG